MEQNYYFIDGSALLCQVKALWKASERYKNKKLNPLIFINCLMYSFPELGSSSYKRAVFYFPNGEQNLKDYFIMPDMTSPGLIRDINFKYCGEKLKKSNTYDAWLETVPSKFRDRCVKSEKGVDTEICCDALKLAYLGKIERLFFLSNDRDFIPLCRTLKDFGVNVSLLKLSQHTTANILLASECDSYDVLSEDKLEQAFGLDISTQNEIKNIKETFGAAEVDSTNSKK